MSENERLAERLHSIAAALNPQAAKTAAPTKLTASDHAEVAAAEAFLQQSPAGLMVLTLLRQVLGVLHNHHDALSALQKENAEIKKSAVTYGDVWRESNLYKPNQMVTHKGQLWMAQEPNANCRPGTNNAWKAMHKNH
jgi:hypothetical protein